MPTDSPWTPPGIDQFIKNQQRDEATRRKGDAALLAAITNGAPVPTTEAQAKELTQRGDGSASLLARAKFSIVELLRLASDPKSTGYINRTTNAIRMAENIIADATAVAKDIHARETNSPTPPAAPGEWKYEVERPDVGGWDIYQATNGTTTYRNLGRDEARDLAQRLNRADAMERALKEINDLPFHATRADVFAIVMRYEAALRK
jgi:hypothetical protein